MFASDGLERFAGNIGKYYRLHRRSLPTEVRDATAQLLLVMRPFIAEANAIVDLPAKNAEATAFVDMPVKNAEAIYLSVENFNFALQWLIGKLDTLRDADATLRGDQHQIVAMLGRHTDEMAAEAALAAANSAASKNDFERLSRVIEDVVSIINR